MSRARLRRARIAMAAATLVLGAALAWLVELDRSPRFVRSETSRLAHPTHLALDGLEVVNQHGTALRVTRQYASLDGARLHGVPGTLDGSPCGLFVASVSLARGFSQALPGCTSLAPPQMATATDGSVWVAWEVGDAVELARVEVPFLSRPPTRVRVTPHQRVQRPHAAEALDTLVSIHACDHDFVVASSRGAALVLDPHGGAAGLARLFALAPHAHASVCALLALAALVLVPALRAAAARLRFALARPGRGRFVILREIDGTMHEAETGASVNALRALPNELVCTAIGALHAVPGEGPFRTGRSVLRARYVWAGAPPDVAARLSASALWRTALALSFAGAAAWLFIATLLTSA